MAIEILDVNTYFGPTPTERADASAQTLVSTLVQNEVQWCLTLSTFGVLHSDSAGNIDTMNACANYDRLIPVATLNPLYFFGKEGQVEELASLPFEMFRFFPHRQGWPISFAPFADIIKRLSAAKSVPLMISIRTPGDISALARTLDGYSQAVILAGVAPDTLAECISVMKSEPLFHVETHGLRSPDALTLLRDTVGIQRVLFGSSAPGKSMAAALRAVKRSDLSTEEQLAVLGGNAHSLWHGTEAG
jgi:hypothetical protein